ncbi:hypothetical protein QKW52_04220 [Bacillus sonorensis]|nr:hypothetical protein [Bacillus sonorensis]
MLKADRHRKTLLMSLFLFILVGFLQSQNVRVDMRANEYGNMAIFYVTSCLGTACVILISFKLQHAALLQFLGRNSLIILVLHYPVIRMLKAIIYYFMNVSLDETYGSVLWGGVYTAVTLLIMVPCILLLNRYPVLLGRKKDAESKRLAEILQGVSAYFRLNAIVPVTLPPGERSLDSRQSLIV